MFTKRILVGALALTAASSFAQFADQTLAVLTYGDGTTVLSAAAVPTQLANFTKTGAAGAATVNLGIFNSGNSTSEGALLKDGGTSGNVYAIGYANTTANTAGSVSGSTGVQNPRTIARFNYLTGATSTITLGANDFSGNNPRSAVVQNGIIYAGGTGSEGGVLTGPDTGPTNDLIRQGTATTGSTNARVVQFLGDTTYFSTGSTSGGAVLGINQVNADGSVTAVASLVGTGTGTVSPYDFFFSDANTLYVADDRVAASGGGIYRFTRSAGAFGTGTLIFNTPVRQLAFDGTTIFGTTIEGSNNNLLSIALDGSSSTILASAGANRLFRGVEVVPEPASMAAIGIGLVGLAARRRKKSA